MASSAAPAPRDALAPKSLGILLLKPSHYDDDGYVIQWWRSFMFSNTLSVVDSLLKDAADQRAATTGLRLETRLIDEMTEIVKPAELQVWLDGFDRCAVFLIGVQSSQYHRAVDIGREFTSAGYPVIIGGFHVSGALALVPDWKPAFAGLEEAGIAIYAGELETGLDMLLDDILAGAIKPLYSQLNQPADLLAAPPQRPTPELADRTLQKFHGLELGRGCPFVCSFCAIINVHGRTMRHRSPDAVRAYVRACVEQGGHSFLISDDNFSRSPIWREVTAELADLRREINAHWDIWIQVDALATRVPGFVEACQAAGITRILIGLESVRPDNLKATGKGQNKVHQLRDMMVTWKQAGVILYTGVILGLPNDTPERIAEDVRYMQEVLPIDLPEFFIYTPLPGSEDHRRMVAEGKEVDTDFNLYDTSHVTCDHPLMSRQQLQDLFWRCWKDFHSWSHLKTVLARGLLHGQDMKELRNTFVCARGLAKYEKLHPVSCGLIRIRNPATRRAGFPRPARIPHVIGEVFRNLRTMVMIGGGLAYASWVERSLRRQLKRGQLEHYRLELSPEGKAQAARTATSHSDMAPQAAE